MRLGIVTATLDYLRAEDCILSWVAGMPSLVEVYVVLQGQGSTGWTTHWSESGLYTVQRRVREILGVVPAFAIGVQKALEDGCEIIACLHDDLEIQEHGWDETVSRLFRACPRAGLCGFGGGKGLGSDDIYQTPYNPMQLARQGFRSNMRDAEAHGVRSTVAEPVACLDGFSQIGVRAYWQGVPHLLLRASPLPDQDPNLFAYMERLGIIHHAYDSALGAYAKMLGYQVWFLPVKCHHFGGRTAVGDARYQDWASNYQYEDQETGRGGQGDQGFWEKSHRVVYELFRDILPIRT